jgi:hypothetical protein
MPSLALCLVLGAALIHAGWNYLAKMSGGDVRFALITCIAQIVATSPDPHWRRNG